MIRRQTIKARSLGDPRVLGSPQNDGMTKTRGRGPSVKRLITRLAGLVPVFSPEWNRLMLRIEETNRNPRHELQMIISELEDNCLVPICPGSVTR